MSNFWPSGLEIGDTQTPLDILKTATEEWESNSDGMLTLVLQQTESEDGTAVIIVHAKHLPSEKTVTLFSVVHRPNASYPATIQPRREDLPDVLKRSYYKPGIGEFPLPMPMHGSMVENKWVSDTPREFRTKLVDVFNLSSVKTAVLGLTSARPRGADPEGGESSEQQDSAT